MNSVKGTIKPLKDYILISDMSFDERTSSGGIVLLKDDGKSEGIRPRWGKVFAIGPEQKDVQVGEWILVEHGRWTRGIKYEDSNGNELVLRRVDNNALLASATEKPNDV